MESERGREREGTEKLTAGDIVGQVHANQTLVEVVEAGFGFRVACFGPILQRRQQLATRHACRRLVLSFSRQSQ